MIKTNILTCCFLMFHVCAVYADCSVDPLGWDWHRDNYEVVDDTSRRAVRQSPFVDGNSFGVSLAGQGHCYEDGWRLFQKKMSCDDYNIDCDIYTAVTDGEYRSIFALYNIHSGLLRTFIHTHGFEIDDEELVINVELTYGDSGESNLGYMLHESTPIIVLDEKYDAHNASNEDNVILFTSYSEKWVVFDKFLSYDPSDDNYLPDLQLTFNMSRINTSELYVEGVFEFTTTGTIGSQGSKSGSISLSMLKDVAYSYSDPSKWADDGNKAAEKIREKDYTYSGQTADALESIAGLIGDYSTPLGYANAGLTLYNSFFGSGSGSSTSIVNLHSEGTLSLEGTLQSFAPIEIVTLGMHGSPQSSSVDETDLASSGYTGKLGLVSLSDRPEVVLKPRTINLTTQSSFSEPYMTYRGQAEVVDYRLVSSIEDLIELNPDSKMKLVNYGIRPAVDFNSPNDTAINYRLYSDEKINCNVILSGYGLNCVYQDLFDSMNSLSDDVYKSSEFIYAPLLNKISNVDSSVTYKGALEGSFMRKWGMIESINYNPPWKIAQRRETSIKDFYLIVYLELEHETHQEIFTEFTLKVPVSLGLCGSLPRSFVADHDESEFFTPDFEQCSGDNDTDGDGHSDNDEIAAGSNPHVFSDQPASPDDTSCGSCHL